MCEQYHRQPSNPFLTTLKVYAAVVLYKKNHFIASSGPLVLGQHCLKSEPSYINIHRPIWLNTSNKKIYSVEDVDVM